MLFSSACTKVTPPEIEQNPYVETDVIESLTLVESDTPSYQYVQTFLPDIFKPMIPKEYGGYGQIRIFGLDYDNVIYLVTEKDDSNDCSMDVFSYNLDTKVLEHIVDISRLHETIMSVFRVGDNFYLCTQAVKKEIRKLYLYSDNKLQFLTDDIDSSVPMIKLEDYVEILQSVNCSVVKYYGENKKIVKTQMFPSLLYVRTPLTYKSLTDGAQYLCIENGEELTKYDVGKRTHVLAMQDIYWAINESENGSYILQAYNYNNEKLLEIEEDSGSYSKNTDNTLFRIEYDGDLWVYELDKENGILTRCKLERESEHYDGFLANGNYCIYCYKDPNNHYESTYDLYRKK